MVYQYDAEPRVTAVQLKYKEYKQNQSKNNEGEFEKTIKQLEKTSDHKSPLHEFNPNSRFKEAFNLNKQKDQEINVVKEIESEFDSNGNRLACVWKNSTFAATYDPLSIYYKKGNYEDLAWKIHRDLEDTNIFMKVLYYPKLIKEDYINLINIYEEKSSHYRRQNALSNGLVFGAAALSWGLAYRRNFKFASFVFLTGATFIGLKYVLSRYLLNSLNDNLNNKSKSIAEKYPEIKYLSIEYVESPKI